MIKNIKLIIICSLFFMGLYYYLYSENLVENFSMSKNKCPNILYQKDNKVFLYNSTKAKVPGVNPISFDNLEEYSEYIDWLRSNGIQCPILYLQKSYDTQDQLVYKIRPSPTELQGGLSEKTIYLKNMQNKMHDESPDKDIEYLYPPEELDIIDANNDTDFNKKMYPSFDPQNLYIGLNTPIDKKFHSKEKISGNAMDTNWGGVKFTQDKVDKGDYEADEILIKELKN